MNQLDKENLIKAAQIASGNSRAYKSNFYVGSAIRLEEGEKGIATHIVTGANVEYNGHPSTHAEVTALTKLISSNIKEHNVVALAVWCPTGPWFPCYCCLQALSSHLSDDVLIIAASPEGSKELTLGELTPNIYKGRQR